MEKVITDEIISECSIEMENAMELILHCTHQLDDEQIWFKPQERMNSTGMLINYVCGNLKQWIINTTEKNKDTQSQPAEFEDENRLKKNELIALVIETKVQAAKALKYLDAENLMTGVQIQGYHLSVIGVIFRSIAHLTGYSYQIAFLSRMQLGEKYIAFRMHETELRKTAMG